MDNVRAIEVLSDLKKIYQNNPATGKKIPMNHACAEVCDALTTAIIKLSTRDTRF